MHLFPELVLGAAHLQAPGDLVSECILGGSGNLKNIASLMSGNLIGCFHIH